MSSDTQPTSDPTSAPTESRRIVVEYYGTRYTVTVYPAGPDWLDEGHEEPQSLEESGPFCARCGWTP